LAPQAERNEGEETYAKSMPTSFPPGLRGIIFNAKWKKHCFYLSDMRQPLELSLFKEPKEVHLMGDTRHQVFHQLFLEIVKINFLHN
jgi:hypothetical protein